MKAMLHKFAPAMAFALLLASCSGVTQTPTPTPAPTITPWGVWLEQDRAGVSIVTIASGLHGLPAVSFVRATCNTFESERLRSLNGTLYREALLISGPGDADGVYTRSSPGKASKAIAKYMKKHC